MNPVCGIYRTALLTDAGSRVDRGRLFSAMDPVVGVRSARRRRARVVFPEPEGVVRGVWERVVEGEGGRAREVGGREGIGVGCCWWGEAGERGGGEWGEEGKGSGV